MARKAGSFNAYLEYAQRQRKDMPQSEPAGVSAILKLLAGAGSGVRLTQLAQQTAMSAAAFQEALKKLKDSEFIMITGSPLEEIVELTPKGFDIAAIL